MSGTAKVAVSDKRGRGGPFYWFRHLALPDDPLLPLTETGGPDDNRVLPIEILGNFSEPTFMKRIVEAKALLRMITSDAPPGK